jgi:hypothetical protein
MLFGTTPRLLWMPYLLRSMTFWRREIETSLNPRARAARTLRLVDDRIAVIEATRLTAKTFTRAIHIFETTDYLCASLSTEA